MTISWVLRCAIVWALAAAEAASAQPSDIRRCLSIDTDEPTCQEVGGIQASPDCGRLFEGFFGRIAWFPLRCAGPITIEVESIALPNTQFPLYIEIVPLGPATPEPCNTDLGFVAFVVYGDSGPCGGWTTSGEIDITQYVPLGGLYAFRLHFLGNSFGHSPTIDCIRITSHPTTTSGIDNCTWGRLKSLCR